MLPPGAQDAIRKGRGKFSRRYRITTSAEFQAILEIRLKMMTDYSFANYPGHLTLFFGSRSKGVSDVIYDPTRGWRNFVTDCDIVDVEGKHENLLEEPFCAGVVKAIEQRLEVVDSNEDVVLPRNFIN
jgi:thioesterase domain-containing protein